MRRNAVKARDNADHSRYKILRNMTDGDGRSSSDRKTCGYMGVKERTVREKGIYIYIERERERERGGRSREAEGGRDVERVNDIWKIPC